MSSRPPAGTDWVRMQVWGRGDQKEFSNDLWFSLTSGSFSPGYDYHGACQAFFTAFKTAWQPAFSTEWLLRGVTGTFNNGAGSLESRYYQTVLGGDVTLALPGDVALVVSKTTANFAPGGKGRWYWTGVGQSEVDGSYLVAPTPTIFTTFAIMLKTAFTSGGITFSPAHFSPKLNMLLPIIDTPVTALLGTTRRRRGPF